MARIHLRPAAAVDGSSKVSGVAGLRGWTKGRVWQWEAPSDGTSVQELAIAVERAQDAAERILGVMGPDGVVQLHANLCLIRRGDDDDE